MATFFQIVAGGLVIAHGLVHLLFLADDVPVFSFEGSWLVPDAVARTVGLSLMASTIAMYVLVGMAVWGVPGLADIWPLLTIIASAVSLVLLLAYWDTQFVLGVAIDIALIVVAVLRPDWTDRVG